MNKIIILINRLSDQPTIDEMDVIDQVEAVEKSLDELGLVHEREFVDSNLNSLIDKLMSEPGGIAFNLVESLNNSGGLVYFIPALSESLNYPMTGNPSDAMFLTTQKPLAKKLMKGMGIPTPQWWTAKDSFNLDPARQYIVKPSREDASVGINDENVINGADTGILEMFRNRWGDHFFIEEFITGREFNLSVFGGPNGPEVLSPAEMIYKDFPAGKPSIMGYAAKWDENTFEYRNTMRTFDLPESDQPLLEQMKVICYQCWSAFNLKGYARIDFRIDQDNQPYVLEINANPCISPDSGFYNAALRSGYSFTEVVQRILNDR
ncbi:MAG: ATP-grasp domain-containing protein [Bacteroidia bacterium]|nr:ATP-grasp domain-containing protein [Bacteroidia bacterium]